MYSTVTHDIKVSVKPMFLEDESDPDTHRYIWAYRIEIENLGSKTVQLLNRHWRITDSRGETQEVKGPGVVGEQPVLACGESFNYTSGAPLTTPSGFMVGTFEMTDMDGNHFDIAIPAFSLDSPHGQHTVN
ncbi:MULTISPECIES: Co2+/Mg2+ efflux protein ApaG [Thalassospira]|uniref:Protein ApaG n=3 Tax=Thalassospira TaxID=168934 RepID=A0A853L448_9PROT|nr:MULTISPECIES: Co2+/Mg2+ efflux protein ApaG [Thalassospira]KXJ51143.1 MAG: Co2+/Mg2+ efflux protein ApaG [Thalassospira sp. Nap_22]OAZ15464.1 ApaG [Thalassospira profundimaris]AXO17043.1 Co2+/Mg2+ efflux protein ApaG [Thalassospira indica]EKF10506.1 CO2+/MG2+ efflux protein ApaG [Thalassospira profundimaris WP0211]MBO6580768.1 Co2+/Mg2+ efflux protein ApaG [Thalassospira sp.]